MAVKHDLGKAPVRRGLIEYFPLACLAVANVSLFGASKYEWNSWQNLEDGINRYGDAALRHACQPGYEDNESGLPHAAHEAWNALARLELILREEGYGDNPQDQQANTGNV